MYVIGTKLRYLVTLALIYVGFIVDSMLIVCCIFTFLSFSQLQDCAAAESERVAPPMLEGPGSVR